jgi:hypothetical protein
MMRLLALMAMCSLAAACGSSQSPADDEAAVAAAAKTFQTAMDTGDAPTVMRYIADDALMMEGGTIENRMQYETNHLPADLEFAKGMTATRMPVQQTVLPSSATSPGCARPPNSVARSKVSRSRCWASRRW